MLYTRREAGKLALAALALPRVMRSDMLARGSKINGVGIGVITYSFRVLPSATAVLAALRTMGFTEVELMYSDAEELAGAPIPRGGGGRGTADRATAIAWRTAATEQTFAPVSKMFADAGIDIRVLCFNMNASLVDAEIDYAFNLGTWLGARAISTTTQVSMAPRIAPFADRHRMMIGFHGHDQTDRPDEFSTPESFAKAMALSKYHGVNLDIGHFVAAGFDPIAYITEHHDRITNLHLKDRKRNHGANVPWGQGDTPVTEVLHLLRDRKWDIPANIEFEYSGDPLIEVPKCLDYCRRALA